MSIENLILKPLQLLFLVILIQNSFSSVYNFFQIYHQQMGGNESTVRNQQQNRSEAAYSDRTNVVAGFDKLNQSQSRQRTKIFLSPPPQEHKKVNNFPEMVNVMLENAVQKSELNNLQNPNTLVKNLQHSKSSSQLGDRVYKPKITQKKDVKVDLQKFVQGPFHNRLAQKVNINSRQMKNPEDNNLLNLNTLTSISNQECGQTSHLFREPPVRHSLCSQTQRIGSDQFLRSSVRQFLEELDLDELDHQKLLESQKGLSQRGPPPKHRLSVDTISEPNRTSIEQKLPDTDQKQTQSQRKILLQVVHKLLRVISTGKKLSEEDYTSISDSIMLLQESVSIKAKKNKLQSQQIAMYQINKRLYTRHVK